MKHFDIKTHIYFGEKSLDRILGLPYKKALIISDPYVVKSGMIHLVTSRLQQAGLAFNTASLGINHSMAHQLGAEFHIPHGRSNAMLLPHIIEYNSEIDKYSRLKTDYPKHVRKYATVARTLGLQNFNIVTTVRALSNWCQFMMKEMDMPLSISETGVCTESEYFARIPEMAKAALLDVCTKTNPRVPTLKEIETLYAQLW